MGANSEVLFTNVRILDGSGEHLPYPGSVRVRGQRIVRWGAALEALVRVMRWSSMPPAPRSCRA